MTAIKLARMNPELVAEQIGNFIVNEITSINYTGGIIGLSGGVDSTTTAVLAKRAFDKYNLKNPVQRLELVGYILPSEVNNVKDTVDGEKVAKRLGIRYRKIGIESVVESFRKFIPATFEANYHKGNLMSEIRAVILHREAATEKKLVLGTGNRDEDFGAGYYTLFGDGAVHLSPIGNLPKRLVRDMACYLGFKDLAYRVPTAGLEPGQTDFGDLGYEYDFVELVSEGELQGISHSEINRHPQIIKAAQEQLLLYEKNFGKKKFYSVEEILEDIFSRRKIANAKSRMLHPPIAEITLDYRGRK